MEQDTHFRRICWETSELRCILVSEGSGLEIRLLDRRGLVALWLCRDWAEAFDLAVQWKMDPPRWWPPADLAA